MLLYNSMQPAPNRIFRSVLSFTDNGFLILLCKDTVRDYFHICAPHGQRYDDFDMSMEEIPVY